MKLLFLTHNYPLYEGDIRGKFFQPLIGELLGNGIKVVVSTPFWKSEVVSGTEVLMSISGETVTRFPWDGSRLQSLSPWRINDLISFFSFYKTWSNSVDTIIRKESDFDYVIAAWAIPSGLLFFNRNLRGVRKGVWFLGTDLYRFKKFPFDLVLKQILKKSDEVWGNSKRLVEDIEEKLSTKASFLPLVAERLEKKSIPHERQLRQGKTVRLLSIGRLEKVKGFDISIKACLRIIDRGIDIHYEIIGSGPLMDNLIQIIAGKTEKITLLGKVDDEVLMKHLSDCDAVIIPSRSEGGALVFFEALEAGKPVIATDVGDIGVCLKGSPLGRVTPVGDVEGLAESISMLVNGEFSYDRIHAESLMDEYSIGKSVNKIKKAMMKR